jgi:hypothetical protein
VNLSNFFIILCVFISSKFCIPTKMTLHMQKMNVVSANVDLGRYPHSASLCKQLSYSSKFPAKYFIAYKQLKQGNKIILANMATAFNFPSNLQLSASRPFISCKKIHSMPKLLQKKLILCCQVKTFKSSQI